MKIAHTLATQYAIVYTAPQSAVFHRESMSLHQLELRWDRGILCIKVAEWIPGAEHLTSAESTSKRLS
jgi:hypothetical protein